MWVTTRHMRSSRFLRRACLHLCKRPYAFVTENTPGDAEKHPVRDNPPVRHRQTDLVEAQQAPTLLPLSVTEIQYHRSKQELPSSYPRHFSSFQLPPCALAWSCSWLGPSSVATRPVSLIYHCLNTLFIRGSPTADWPGSVTAPRKDQ